MSRTWHSHNRRHHKKHQKLDGTTKEFVGETQSNKATFIAEVEAIAQKAKRDKENDDVHI